jgi:GDSL-like Lipase/Acylhydrolase family
VRHGAPTSHPAQALSPTAYPTITFDEVPLETFVTNEYVSKGVVFTSTVQTATDESNPTSPVLSGYPRFEGRIEGYFVNPATGEPLTITSFTLDVGYIDKPDSVVVEAFDAGGNLVQSVLANSLGINTLTLTFKGMASFSVHEVAEEPAGFAIDNLSIDPSGNPTAVQSVASMGDSYSSGEGLLLGLGTNYDCGTDMPSDLYYQDTTLPYLTSFRARPWGPLDCDTRTLTNQEPILSARGPAFYENTCHRHDLAYPVQIARILHATQSIFIACSGATTANIGEIPSTAKSQHPQSPVNVAGGNTQVTDLKNFRTERLGGADPSVITIGIGGNDAGFASIAEHCIALSLFPCSSDQSFVDTVLNKITGPVYESLEGTFAGLRVDFPNSTIVAFGYPTPVSASAPGCNGAPLYQQDKAFLGVTVLDTLNQTIAEAAEAAGISYVDVSSVTVGHEVCTSEPWFRGLSWPIGQSFHPTQLAHDEIARYFREHYTDGSGNLLIHNPPSPANPIRVGPSGVVGNLANLQGGPVGSCGAGCIDAVPCVQSCSVQIQGSGYAPQAQLEAVLHSASYDLGPITADDSGNINVTVQIPLGVATGQHIITLDGTAPDGSPQYGTLGVDILEAPTSQPNPPGPSASSTSPSQGVLAIRTFSHPVRALVTLKRRKGRLTARVACPRTTASMCMVTLSLRRTRRVHGRTRSRSLASRTVRVPAGQYRTVTLTNAAALTAPHQLRVVVVTITKAGRAVQSLAVPS